MGTCIKCGGKDGAHYLGCVLEKLFERLLGPGYPMFGSGVHDPADVARQFDLDVDEPEPLPPPPPVDAPMWERRHAGRPWSEQPIEPPVVSGKTSIEDRRVWAKLFIEERVIRDVAGHVLTPSLLDTYNAWAKDNDGPISGGRGPASVMRFLSEEGFRRGVRNGRPGFIGMRLRAAGERAHKAPVAEPEQEADPTAEIRRLMGAARPAQRPPEPEPPVFQVAEDHPQVRTNNGWHKRYTAEELAAVEVEDVDLPAPTPAAKRTYRYDGPRPGREIPKEYRELVKPLLDTPGWRYAPHNGNGRGKPRIYNPDGQSLCLPNTPSDVKGLMATKTMLRTSLGAAL